MLHSDSIKQLTAALIAAEQEMGSVYKGGWNEHNKYRYAMLGDILNACKAILLKHNIMVVASAYEVRDVPHCKADKGNRVFVMLDVLIAHASGEWMVVKSAGEGCDTQDKAVYKAITGARKYALTSALNLSTEDEPEDDSKEPKSERAAAANTKLGVPAATGVDLRKQVAAICKEKNIALTKVKAWLGSNGYENMAEAPEAVQYKLLAAVNAGDL